MTRNTSFTSRIVGLAGWLSVTFIAAAIGSVASIAASAFYGQLIQPAWAPPAWLFGPVWTVLYIAMGISAWLVWKDRGYRSARLALNLFLVQLALNSLWSWLFFAWQLGAWAFVDIVVLWVLIVATLVAFFRINRASAWLLIPYLLWVSFALALNYSVWQLNPGTLG